jgi:replicative DNA helicase
MLISISLVLTECVEHIEKLYAQIAEETVIQPNSILNSSSCFSRKIPLPLSISLHAAYQQNICTAYIDAQCNRLDTVMLLLSHISTVPFQTLKTAALEDSDWAKLAGALDVLNNLPIFFRDDSHDYTDRPVSVAKIIHRLEEIHACEKLGMIVLNTSEIERENHAQTNYRNANLFKKINEFATQRSIPILISNKMTMYQ